MMVNGPLEIYSTVIGAHLYDNIFNILAATGLAFLPFLGLFFQNITTPYESEITNGADTSFRRVSIQFFLMVFFIMLFVAPTHNLDLTSITYRPVCSAGAAVSKYGDTGTTYDDVFSDLQYQNVHLPLGLMFILNGASGITNAAIVTLPCKTDVQKIAGVIDSTRLPPELSQEVSRFQQECYSSAKSTFNNQHPDLKSYQNTMKMYGGESDLSWMGSHVFQQLYYSGIYPSSAISSFPYSAYPYRYQDYNSKAGVDTPKGGYPSCLAWWTDSEYGLEKRLVGLIKAHQPNNPHLGEIPIKDQLNSWLAKVKTYTKVGSQVTADDVMIRGLLYDVNTDGGFGRMNKQWMNSNVYQYSSGDLATSVIIGAGDTAAVVGQGYHRVFSSMDRTEIDQEIPILQAVLMALCLALGPLILVLGGYRINVIFSYYFILTSIISITFVEKFIHYLEMSLYASQSYGMGAAANTWVMYNLFTKLYFYAPMLFLMLMTICGVQLGGAVGHAFNSDVSGKGSGFGGKVVSALLTKKLV